MVSNPNVVSYHYYLHKNKEPWLKDWEKIGSWGSKKLRYYNCLWPSIPEKLNIKQAYQRYIFKFTQSGNKCIL